VDDAFSKQFVPKILLQAPNAGAVLNFVAWRDGRDQIHDTPLAEQLVLLVQNGTIILLTEQLATLVRTHAKHSNLKMRNWST